jgi:hypothetical protein
VNVPPQFLSDWSIDCFGCAVIVKLVCPFDICKRINGCVKGLGAQGTVAGGYMG